MPRSRPSDLWPWCGPPMGGRRGTRGVGTAHPLPVQPPPTIPPAARTTTQRNVFSSCDSINTAVEERCRSDPRREELEGHGCLERGPAGFMCCAMLIYHFLPSAYHRLLGGWVYANCFHSFPSILLSSSCQTGLEALNGGKSEDTQICVLAPVFNCIEDEWKDN